MKKIIFILLFLSVMAKETSAQKTHSAKDTVYFLLDTAQIPIKDRVFEINKVNRFKCFMLMCKCYPWEINPEFYYAADLKGITIDNEKLKTISTISITKLIDIAFQFGKDKIKNTIFYFIEPDGEQKVMHETFLMPPRKPTIVY